MTPSMTAAAALLVVAAFFVLTVRIVTERRGRLVDAAQAEDLWRRLYIHARGIPLPPWIDKHGRLLRQIRRGR